MANENSVWSEEREDAYNALARSLMDAVRETSTSNGDALPKYNLPSLMLDFEGLLAHEFGDGDLFMHIVSEDDKIPIPTWIRNYMNEAETAEAGLDYGALYNDIVEFKHKIVVETILMIFSYLSLPSWNPRARRILN